MWNTLQKMAQNVDKPYVEERESNYKYRNKAGYACIVEVNAKMIEQAYEEVAREPLVWNKMRFNAAMTRELTDAYPLVYKGYNRKVDVLDGRHRIGAAAAKGQRVDVAVPCEEADYFVQNFEGKIVQPNIAKNPWDDIEGETNV